MEYFKESEFDYKFINEHPDSLILVYPGKDQLLLPDTIQYYKDILKKDYKLDVFKIGTNTDGVTRTTLAGIQGRLSEMGNQGSRIAKIEGELRVLNTAYASLRQAAESQNSDTARFNVSRRSLKLAFPDVESAYFAEVTSADSTGNYTLVAVQRGRSGRRQTTTEARSDRNRMREILLLHTKADSLVLVVEGL
jgi:hypothetical protein